MDVPMIVKEVKTERRRLSFQAMEKSESELTASPSPDLQKRVIKVSTITSSSEDIKTESADSSIDDDEFIRKQIIDMGDDVEMSVSEEEKEKSLEMVYAIKPLELDNASMTVRPLSQDTNNEETQATQEYFTKAETMPKPTFKKAIPVIRQRQSTDEEVESITESLSKGSSSIQASSFTPGSSPTSASSLEEDSDGSPRKISGDKLYHKGKHKQPAHSLPTIEDSSEEEKMKAQGRFISPHGDASSTEDLRKGTDESLKTSDSDYSVSVESEAETGRAVQRGQKPSPTVIPYSPSDPFQQTETVTKSLKSAEETYEEILQKAKAIPGESPDIEPLYGGMAIEDYLYESLVEEPEINLIQSQEEEFQNDSRSQSLKKLRSPEEVYEEMMQKKKELLMIEEEFQQTQSAVEFSSSDALACGTPSAAETCVVTMPTEEKQTIEQTELPHLVMDTLSELPMKKKKRPAPPRPSEPPKRSEGAVVPPSTHSGSISFVRPMVPLDPALRKALFPIPDLKITQCSSGEEEDDSLVDEYTIGISSDITPSDDSESKEDQSISPPLSEAIEMEPICVVCEIPEPKPIPAPISAPELTTTPSPVSPVSPPTSPATPDSSLVSNETSSSPFQAQTPLSSDSTPLSTPTPQTYFKDQSHAEVAPPFSEKVATVPTSENEMHFHGPTTVVVAIPDVVSDPAKPTTDVTKVEATTSQDKTPTLKETWTQPPVVVQMPDLVSSPSQVPFDVPTALHVSVPSPALVVVSAQSATQVTAPSVVPSISTLVGDVSFPVTVVSCPRPVIVQMPDLVSTTASIASETPHPISALISSPIQAQTRVVHSVPVQSAIPSMSPVIVPAKGHVDELPQPVPASTTVIKKKVPPPPPPRSTSVSLAESAKNKAMTKTIDVTATTSSLETTTAILPLQSVVVDIQPRMDAIKQDVASVPQVITSARQDHVVIKVPSVENRCADMQTTQDWVGIDNTGLISTPHLQSQITPQLAPDMPTTVISPPSSKLPAVKLVSGPPLPSKPSVGTKAFCSEEALVLDSTSSLTSDLPKPSVYQKPCVFTPATYTMAIAASTLSSSNQNTKPPPPIPPKPTSIPAGLVFSHKPGENIKPPPPPVAPKAATLPRTKQPPNALSLSLTRPVESKLGVSSPKSPLSPRHSKCLQTYVVITLPSELGSPTETITVQAPVRRGSIPSSTVSVEQTILSEHKTPADVFTAQATVRRTSVPSVKHPPSNTVAPNVAMEQVTNTNEMEVKLQARTKPLSSAVQPQLPSVNIASRSSPQDNSIQAHRVPSPIKRPYAQQELTGTSPLSTPQTVSEVITMPADPDVFHQPQICQESSKREPTPLYPQESSTVKETETIPQLNLREEVYSQTAKLMAAVQPQSLTKVVTVPLQPSGHLDTPVLQSDADQGDKNVGSPEILLQKQFTTENQDIPTHVIVTEDIQVRYQVQEDTHILTEKSQTICLELAKPTQPEVITVGNNASTISDFSFAPQFLQSFENQSIVPEQVCTQQSHLLSDEVLLLTEAEIPTRAISTDSSPEALEVAVVHTASHPQNVVAEITQTPFVTELLTQPKFDQVMTPTTTEIAPTSLTMEVQQDSRRPSGDSFIYIADDNKMIPLSMMSHAVPLREVITMTPELEMPTKLTTNETDLGTASMPSSEGLPQTVVDMPVLKHEETTYTRRTSISSAVQPSYILSDGSACPAEYEMPIQVITTEAFAANRRESLTMQPPLAFAQVPNIAAEKDFLIDNYTSQVPYISETVPNPDHELQELRYSVEYDHPAEIMTTEAYARRTSVPPVREISQGVPVAPVTITKIQQESIESQEIRGPEKVVSSMSHVYSSISTSAQPPKSLPSMVTQVVTTEVQRTTVSVVHERLPQAPPSSVEITIQPDFSKVQSLSKQNGKTFYPGDVIDLRTVKDGIKMTEQGMDLTSESDWQSFSSDSSGRQITAVQPEIVNLSAEVTPVTTLSVVTDSITIVTCTATVASYNTPAEKPLDLQGPVTSLPLPLTTYKPFEPLAQIVYRPVKPQPIVKAVLSTDQETPINLSFENLVSSGGKLPEMSAPISVSSEGIITFEATGAMDLSKYRPRRSLVAMSDTSPGVVTTVLEDDGIPVDLTANSRSVCCDVIYKLPFTGICKTQPAVTTQPDSNFGNRDDHFQNVNAGLYSINGTYGIKAPVSEINLTPGGRSLRDLKNNYDYIGRSSDDAVDLTAAKFSTGKCLHLMFLHLYYHILLIYFYYLQIWHFIQYAMLYCFLCILYFQVINMQCVFIFFLNFALFLQCMIL